MLLFDFRLRVTLEKEDVEYITVGGRLIVTVALSDPYKVHFSCSYLQIIIYNLE